MKKQLLKINSYLAIVLFCCFWPVSVFAEKTEGSTQDSVEEQEVGFTIHAVTPESQIDPDTSYYFLKVAPKQEQELILEIGNLRSMEQTFVVTIGNASTNSNGLVVYNDFEIEPHESMKLPLTSLITLPKNEITVPKYGTGKVVMKLKMPDTSFDGIILGGVNVKLKKDTSKGEQANSVGHEFSYVKGILLTQHEKDSLLSDEALKLEKVLPEIDDGSKVLKASFLNEQPKIFKNFKISGVIKEKNTKKVVAKHQVKNGSIAPNSIFEFNLDWGVAEVSSGDYIFEAEVGIGDEKTSYSQAFTISQAAAKKLNAETVFKIILPSWWLNSFIGLSLASLALTCLLIVRQSKMKKLIADTNARKSKKRKKPSTKGG